MRFFVFLQYWQEVARDSRKFGRRPVGLGDDLLVSAVPINRVALE
jgi:hypothetical protein